MEEKIKKTRSVKFCLSFNNLNSVKKKNKKSIGQQNSPDSLPKIKRSMSFGIKRFVPKLSPKKSTVIPSFLKLNNNEKETNEVISVKDCSISDEDSSSSSSSFISSASFKFVVDKDKKSKNGDEKDSDDNSSDLDVETKNIAKKKLNFIESPKIMEDIIEEKENEGTNASCLKKKIGKIKNMNLCNINKEDGEITHEELKNKFDINDKNYNNIEKNNNDLLNEKNTNCKFNLAPTEQKVKHKPLLIRDVLSLNKKNNIQIK